MKTKCLLRNIETGEEIIGLRDKDQAYFSNGQVADFEFWQIVEPLHPVARFIFGVCIGAFLALIGAAFLALVCWGDE